MIKVAFFGINDYGYEILKKIVSNKNYSVAIVTGKSKAVEHVNVLENKLKNYCKDNKLPYRESVDINVDSEIHEILDDTDLGIIGGYDKIIKANVLERVNIGFINTHFGLIPNNRGCNPTTWSILSGINQGYTTYKVNEKIDFGEILDQYSLPNSNLTSYDSYYLLSKVAVERFEFSLQNLLSGKVKEISREPNRYFKQGMPNDSYVSWHWNKDFLLRFYNSLYFPPYKPCRSVYCDLEFFFHVRGVVDFSDSSQSNLSNGTVITVYDNMFIVKCLDGLVVCEKITETNFSADNVLESNQGSIHSIDMFFSGDYI